MLGERSSSKVLIASPEKADNYSSSKHLSHAREQYPGKSGYIIQSRDFEMRFPISSRLKAILYA